MSLEVIKHKLSGEHSHINLYALGDVHIGSQEYDEMSVKKKIDIIMKDPDGYVVLCGDLGDFGLKNSKTNVYEATMQPQAQMEYIYKLFKPLADAGKILAAVPGNHEDRLTRETGVCPTLTLCCRWGIENVYRENLAILRIAFTDGTRKGRNMFTTGIVSHGSTKNKMHKFGMCFEGIDWSIAGHIHTPSYTQAGKIRITAHGNAIKVPFKELVLNAELKSGGYGIKKQYEVSPPPTLDYFTVHCARRDSEGIVIDFSSKQI